MKKTYWIMKTPGNTEEWIEITGKQFYDLVTSSAGKGRYFMDCDTYKIEVSPEQYRQWKSEANHSDYLRSFEDEVLILSLDSLADDDGLSYHELITDTSVNIEDDALHNIDLIRLSEAVWSLEDDERWLIGELFLRDNPKTEREIMALTGIPQQTVNYRKKIIFKKLKKYLVKTEKGQQ